MGSNSCSNENYTACCALKAAITPRQTFISSNERIIDIDFRKADAKNHCKYSHSGGVGEYKGSNLYVSSNLTPKVIKTNDKEKPFTLGDDLTFNIDYLDENSKKVQYKIDIKAGYKWDGASIPKCLQWMIGKNDTPQFAIASMLHDVMCEDHSSVDNDRKLSSNVFEVLLEANGVGKNKAKLMSWCVDKYQKFFSNWTKSNA